MQKIYSRIDWENEPSKKTPINEDNLNKMDYTIDKLDDRVVALYGYQERAYQSEQNAQKYASNAKTSEINAALSAENAKVSEELAKTYMENTFYGTPDGYQQLVEEVGLLDIQTTTDSTLYGSKAGGLKLNHLIGATEQATYNGYQKFDASKLPTTSAGGATVTNNGDGSFTVSGSGELTSNFKINYDLTHEETVKLLTAGTLYNTSTTVKTYPYFFIDLFQNGSKILGITSGNQATITQDILDDETSFCRMGFFGASGTTIVPNTIKPMIYQDGDGTWEPFVGGEPSPNPEYRQSINNTGDCVEMVQGNYIYNTGNYVTNKYRVCNKYPVPCKENDIISITLEKSATQITVVYYTDNKWLSFKANTNIESGQAYTFTVPSGATSFNFTIYNESHIITPETAGKIQLTVNDKYVGQIVETGKNLLSYPYHNTTKTINGITFTDNGDGTITANGTATENADFEIHSANRAKPFKKGTPVKLVGCPSGGDATSKYYLRFQSTNYTQSISDYGTGGTAILDYDTYYCWIRIAKGTTVNNLVFKPMIVDAELLPDITYDDFEPYIKKIHTYYTSQPMMAGDSIVQENGKWCEKHVMFNGIFDGTTEGVWVKGADDQHTENTNLFYVETTPSKEKGGTNVISNSFVTQNIIGKVNDFVGICGNAVNNHIYIRIDQQMSLSEFKTWLQSESIEYQYPLADPVLIELDTASQIALNSLETFDDITYIEVDSRVQPQEVSVDYGTSRVGATALLNANNYEKNKNRYTNAYNANLFGLSGKKTGKGNSVALQQLIDTISLNGGGTIYIPAGTYPFASNGTQTIGEHCIKLKSNVRIVGDGFTTILKPTGHTENGLDMFYYNDYVDFGSKDPLKNCDFENFMIDGSETSVTNYTSAGKGFMINMFEKCHWNNVIVRFTDATGFGVDCPHDSSIENCIAAYCGKSAPQESNTYGASGFGIGYGYDTDECITIRGCRASGNKMWGFFFEHQNRFNTTLYQSAFNRGFIVSDCYAWGNYYNFGTNKAFGVIYRNCFSSEAIQHGYAFINSENCNAVGCYSVQEGDTSFVILQDNRDGSIPDVKDVSFQSCISKYSKYGAKVVSGNGTMTRNLIKDCYFDSETTNNIVTSGTMDNLIIDGNVATGGTNAFNATITDFVNKNNSWNETTVDSKWSGKTFVAFGTSLTALCENYDGGYLEEIRKTCGFASYTNKGVSGAPMVNNTANGNGINYAIKNYAIAEDAIFIETSTNDFKLNVPLGVLETTNVDTYSGALKDAIEYLKSTYPEKFIFLFADPQRDNDGYDVKYANSAGHRLLDYVNMTIAIGNEYGIPVIDWYRNSGINMLNLSNFTVDKLHPNAKGYKRLGEVASGAILNMYSGSVYEMTNGDKAVKIDSNFFDVSVGEETEFKLIMKINDIFYMYISHKPIWIYSDGTNYYETFDPNYSSRATATDKVFADPLWFEPQGLNSVDGTYYRTISTRTLDNFICANHDVKLWGTDTILIGKTFN